MTTPLIDLTAVQAVAAMRRGALSAERYASALLQRADELAHLNAFISLEPDRVLEQARLADAGRRAGAPAGPLFGLPIPVKDSVNTRDYPTTGGTPALARFVPAADAEIVARLRSAGAIVMGKTNIHELSFGWTSNNLAFGAVRNPYDTGRIPGGSSGGTAAAVAAQMAPLGIAEDTQGSIRVPAALCGIYGLRPTQNRYPNTGVVPITPLFDQVGPHARSMGDIALFDSVITGEPPVAAPADLAGIRLGVDRSFFFADLDSEVERLSLAALERLERAGATLVYEDVPGLARLIERTTAQIQLYHVRPMLIRYLDEFAAGVSFDELIAAASADIRATFAEYVLPGAPSGTSEAEFVAARDIHLPELKATMDRYFRAHAVDGLVFPATQVPATPIGEDTKTYLNGTEVPFEPVISRNISPGSTAGLPGLVVPIALDERGLPVSLEIDAAAGGDRRLLEIGLALEEIYGALPPPVVQPVADSVAR